jgi:hypothetical protein
MVNSRSRSIAVVGALSLVLVVLGAPAASAHGSGGQPIPDAKHYLAKIENFAPAVPGLTATVDPRGEWIEVTNASGNTLTIFGYAHEPYLQIGPRGVQQNDRSVSVRLNQSLFGDLSQIQLTQLPPAWRATATTNHVRWHDHRIHWMSPQRPPGVQAHPDRAQLIGHWTVHMQLDSQPVDINGALNWLPVKQSSFLSVGLIIDIAVSVAFLAGLVAFALYRRGRNKTTDHHPQLDPLLDSPDPLDRLKLDQLARRRQTATPQQRPDSDADDVIQITSSTGPEPRLRGDGLMGDGVDRDAASRDQGER